MIVGIVIANGIDPVYRTASTMVYRHKIHKYLARGFVGAVQDVLVACCIPAEYGISLESGSEVDLIDRTVDVELLEGGMTSLKELRGQLSSLTYLSAFSQTQQLDSETYDP
jgi:hypothetical protein